MDLAILVALATQTFFCHVAAPCVLVWDYLTTKIVTASIYVAI